MDQTLGAAQAGNCNHVLRDSRFGRGMQRESRSWARGGYAQMSWEWAWLSCCWCKGRRAAVEKAWLLLLQQAFA